ncbi:MAG: hypothetical protein PXX73_04755 [Sideroxydans sp.]|nr:hypothetical protein [Sideroxydans sp.]
MNQLTQFNGTSVSIIDHNSKKWLTAKEVGLCLGYNVANAGTGITNLYSRHPDRFDETDTCTIKLMVQGQAREVRIFSTTGCVTLGWLANTKRASEFQKWAKQILAEQLNSNMVIPAAMPARSGITRRTERLVFERFVAGMMQRQIAKELDISPSAVNAILRAKYQFSPHAGEPECSHELIVAVAQRHLTLEQDKLFAARERIAQNFLSHANNQPLSDALNAVGRRLMQPLLNGGAA